eukprot:1231220-Alexandrium_andersonii.AAC.1
MAPPASGSALWGPLMFTHFETRRGPFGLLGVLGLGFGLRSLGGLPLPGEGDGPAHPRHNSGHLPAPNAFGVHRLALLLDLSLIHISEPTRLALI